MRLLATVPEIGVEAVAYQTMNGKTITFRSIISLISEKINNTRKEIYNVGAFTTGLSLKRVLEFYATRGHKVY